VKSILADDALPAKDSAERVSLPANIAEIRESDLAGAARVQAEVREDFQEKFGMGYVATGVESRDGTTEYVLEPDGAIAGLRLPAVPEN
jgi:predicted GNAT superfamily acetyltransferase